MKETFKARLRVNSKDIEFNPFVEQFVAGTVAGGVRTLKGAESLRRIELKMEKKTVSLAVDGEALELTQFPNDVIFSTVSAIVSCLKGVDQVIDNLQLDINIERKTT